MKNFIYFIISILAPTLGIAHPFSEHLFTKGHSVYITKSADETHEWKLRLIQEAKHSLEISAGYSYGFVFNELLQTVLYQLENNPDIKIRMMIFNIVELVSNENIEYLCSLRSRFPDRFHFIIHGETSLINQEKKAYITENHTKLIIADEKYILLGGTNLVDPLSTTTPDKYPPIDSILFKFFPKSSCDMDAVISGPIAKKLRQEFYRLYKLHESGEPLENNLGEYKPKHTDYTPFVKEAAEITFFDANPETAHDAEVFGVIAGPRFNLHTIGNIYEYLIQNATVSIDIGNMYFFPRDSIYTALMDAANRGLEINLITNGVHEDFSPNNATRSLYGHLNRLNYYPIMAGRHFNIWQLLETKNTPIKNTSIYELNLNNALYHKKVMTVDNHYSIIGSYNLGMKSEDAAYEVVAAIKSAKAAHQIKSILKQDQKKSKKIEALRALDWYFNPYYNASGSFERKFIDGILVFQQINGAPLRSQEGPTKLSNLPSLHTKLMFPDGVFQDVQQLSFG